MEFPPALLAALAMVAGVNGDPNPRRCGRACVRALGKLSSAFARLIFTCVWPVHVLMELDRVRVSIIVGTLARGPDFPETSSSEKVRHNASVHSHRVF